MAGAASERIELPGLTKLSRAIPTGADLMLDHTLDGPPVNEITSSRKTVALVRH
jgi:hypothetical protein